VCVCVCVRVCVRVCLSSGFKFMPPICSFVFFEIQVLYSNSLAWNKGKTV